MAEIKEIMPGVFCIVDQLDYAVSVWSHNPTDPKLEFALIEEHNRERIMEILQKFQQRIDVTFSSDLCKVCVGTGNLFISASPLKFQTCSHCNGLGVFPLTLRGPKEIKIHSMSFTASALGHTFKLTDFEDSATMAHVMHRAGIFSSVSEARRNGWNKPIEIGNWVVSKRKISVEVVNG